MKSLDGDEMTDGESIVFRFVSHSDVGSELSSHFFCSLRLAAQVQWSDATRTTEAGILRA